MKKGICMHFLSVFPVYCGYIYLVGITCFIWYIITKATNKQNTSKLLLYKLYFIYNNNFENDFKIILFQCDFDFQITTSKMILILNHLYLCELILILKSST